MVRPPPLRRGDVVRVVAPAGPFLPEPFERGLAVLRDRFQLRPRMRPDVTARSGYLAGGDDRRLAEWQEAVADGEARAVWCARGGYGSMRLLPRLEPERLVRAPRLVIGFSDITALHLALNQAGLATVHGPVVTQLGQLPDDALDHLEALLFGRPGPPRDGGPGPGAGVTGRRVIRAGRADGPLLGGSLTLLAALCGTPWQPRLAGAVLFLEEIGERPYRLDRTLAQLRLSGALEGVRGVAVGQLTGCDEPGIEGAAVLRELVRGLEVPAIEGIDAGHESRNLALPLGTRVELVAPGDPAEGPPRLSFAEGTVA